MLKYIKSLFCKNAFCKGECACEFCSLPFKWSWKKMSCQEDCICGKYHDIG